MSFFDNSPGFMLDKIILASKQEGRNLQMPGDGRYQPEELRPFLGYDQQASWLILVEYEWLQVLCELGVIPREEWELFTPALFERLVVNISTTLQDKKERDTNHDIIALTSLMKEILPEPLHKWLHFCATSYDIINTAYALQIKETFRRVVWPALVELDTLWREQIKLHAATLQAGRTHLQTALPITVGCWLANLHNRFAEVSNHALNLSGEVPGKFSGAVGTSASQAVLLPDLSGEGRLLSNLGLLDPGVSTQITPPEGAARFYFELVLLSGVLGNLGEDVRILQSSPFGELKTASSTSSAMSHKTGNPIAAEQLAGMHTTVLAENLKVQLNLVSDLQRDLRGSSVMRSYSAVMVYTFQQIKTAIRLLKSLVVDPVRCGVNFRKSGRLVTAELLHLELQRLGFPDAHKFVNEKIVPKAIEAGKSLGEFFPEIIDATRYNEELYHRVQKALPESPIIQYLKEPNLYIGQAIQIAEKEAGNNLALLE